MLGQFITVIHVFICCFLILIVLLQQGRGADAGATFGGGGQTFFGASGADNLLTKVTTFTAIAFMCTSILLASNLRSNTGGEGELLQMLETKPVASPAASAPVATQDATTPANSGEVSQQDNPAGSAPAATNSAPSNQPLEASTESNAANPGKADTAPAAPADQVGATGATGEATQAP